MEIIQRIHDKFLQVAEIVLNELEEGVDYTEFQRKLKEKLNNLGAEVCQEVLEASDQHLRENKHKREGWNIERQDPKTVVSPFGEVTYTRTYYRHKQTAKYAYLVDEKAGFTPHTRIDPALKADLVEHSTELSYRKSVHESSRHAQGAEVSAQSVLNAIRSSGLHKVADEDEKPRRRLKTLYIEADEDHVSCQDGTNFIAPLIYVHEGKENGRLQNPHYFSGKDPEALWDEVIDYIHDSYEAENIEKIFIAGDGASWIKWGCELIPGSIFLLDRFHLTKYIKAATVPHKDLEKEMWKAINDCSLSSVREVLKKANKRAKTANKLEAVRKCRTYMINHWEGIEAYKKHPEALGCSAEAHVSHILSARLSSRPMGWSKKGAYQMARLRVVKANGNDVKKRYLEQAAGNTSILEVSKKEIQRQRSLQKQTLNEALNNLPALRKSNGPLSTILRAIKSA